MSTCDAQEEKITTNVLPYCPHCKKKGRDIIELTISRPTIDPTPVEVYLLWCNIILATE